MLINDMLTVKHSDKALCRLIDGEEVILIPESATLYALGGCGSRVWELIDGQATVSDIIDIICDEYEVEPETARKDIFEFMQGLGDLHLVEVVTAAGEEVNR